VVPNWTREGGRGGGSVQSKNNIRKGSSESVIKKEKKKRSNHPERGGAEVTFHPGKKSLGSLRSEEGGRKERTKCRADEKNRNKKGRVGTAPGRIKSREDEVRNSVQGLRGIEGVLGPKKPSGLS